jgi:hypothetical protein
MVRREYARINGTVIVTSARFGSRRSLLRNFFM